MKVDINMILVIIVLFAFGFGWGQWWTERGIRKERQKLEYKRIYISMPTDPGKAKAMFALLHNLMEEVEKGDTK